MLGRKETRCLSNRHCNTGRNWKTLQWPEDDWIHDRDLKKGLLITVSPALTVHSTQLLLALWDGFNLLKINWNHIDFRCFDISKVSDFIPCVILVKMWTKYRKKKKAWLLRIISPTIFNDSIYTCYSCA